jgi:hypothetical protein
MLFLITMKDRQTSSKGATMIKQFQFTARPWQRSMQFRPHGLSTIVLLIGGPNAAFENRAKGLPSRRQIDYHQDCT